MDNKDIRWQQRFNNFKKALQKLKEAVEVYRKKGMDDIGKEGLIKRFEYTYELSWNTIKDYYEDQGETGIQGSKNAFRLAYNRGLIDKGDAWMEMIESRKLTVHTYDDKTANDVIEKIDNVYFDLFVKLKEKLEREIN